MAPIWTLDSTLVDSPSTAPHAAGSLERLKNPDAMDWRVEVAS
jgi:hypothetical protein